MSIAVSQRDTHETRAGRVSNPPIVSLGVQQHGGGGGGWHFLAWSKACHPNDVYLTEVLLERKIGSGHSPPKCAFVVAPHAYILLCGVFAARGGRTSERSWRLPRTVPRFTHSAVYGRKNMDPEAVYDAFSDGRTAWELPSGRSWSAQRTSCLRSVYWIPVGGHE